jgi:hypothetical protein
MSSSAPVLDDHGVAVRPYSATDPLAAVFPSRPSGDRRHPSRILTERELSLWIARPTIALKLQASSGALGDAVLPGPRRAGVAVVEEPRIPQRLSLGLGIGRDGFAALWTTENQRRALGGMAVPERLGHTVSDFLASRDVDDRMASAFAECQSLYSRIGQPSQGEFLLVWQQLLNAAIHLALFAVIFDMAGVSRVVVSTQHSLGARSAIAASRQLGIPSIYVPHAPVALNRYYSDLPTDVAGAWGPNEREHYGSLGADTDRVQVVGSAMHDLASDAGHAPVPRSRRVVVAPSAWSDARLREFISLCSSAIRGPFAIAPHPRNPLEVIRAAAPRRADVLTGPTSTHLQSFGALVQCNSGVALEGLLAPLPVINFNPFGLPPNYPMIRAPYVPEVRTKAALRSVLATVLTPRPEPLAGPARDWARGWCAFSGADAETRLRELVHSAERHDEPVLDGWAYA